MLVIPFGIKMKIITAGGFKINGNVIFSVKKAIVNPAKQHKNILRVFVKQSGIERVSPFVEQFLVFEKFAFNFAVKFRRNFIHFPEFIKIFFQNRVKIILKSESLLRPVNSFFFIKPKTLGAFQVKRKRRRRKLN